MQHNQYNTYRKVLAWIGFTVVYLGIPTAIATGVYLLNHVPTDKERTEPFYQQTKDTYAKMQNMSETTK